MQRDILNFYILFHTQVQGFDMKKSMLVLAASIAAAVSMNASAATTGTVNFNGSVVNATCQITTASGNQTVTLPQAVSSDFTIANQAVGQTVPFQIALSGCSASTNGAVAVGFNFSPADGYSDVIKNTTGTATGVGVRVYDSLKKPITMAGTIHHTTPKTLTNGDILFDLEAQYISTASTATPGSVIASTTINVVYP